MDVELPRLEATVRRAQFDDDALAEAREQLESTRHRLTLGRPQFMLDWEWFEPTEQRLLDLTRDVTTILAQDALRNERYQRAIELAGDLTLEDPLDEVAPEIAIRAFLLAGNRAAAILEYRRYSSTLKREIDAPPPDGLTALIRGSPSER
ncbi:MAG: DNA-binding transcriptional activator of the family [Candidatus Eremiobacteraeota bacterium]|nr:DNA-binding transcriptional activator of the family [Candidatus Eremiobacteraeota bacterium]